MHDWQITGTRKRLLGEGEEMCPAKCGKVETYMHYLVCDDPQLSKAQLCLLLTLQQQLKILNTYPGISLPLAISYVMDLIMTGNRKTPLPK